MTDLDTLNDCFGVIQTQTCDGLEWSVVDEDWRVIARHRSYERAQLDCDELLAGRPRIITRHEYPPIPRRDHDWLAYREGEEELGQYGWGRTEPDAIKDLIMNVEDAS